MTRPAVLLDDDALVLQAPSCCGNSWARERIGESRLNHLTAGADHVCIQQIGHGSDSIRIEQLQRLGPALLDL